MITVLKNCAINTYNKRNKAEIPYDEGIETPHGHFNGHVSIDTDKDDVKKAIKSIRKRGCENSYVKIYLRLYVKRNSQDF